MKMRFLPAAALAAVLATTSFAQNCGPGIGPCGNGAGPAARVEARLQTLQSQLALTAAQQPAWNAYAAAVRAAATDMSEDRALMRSDNGTAPERLARRSQIMAEHAAAHAKVAEAMSTLYATLTPQQRALVDASIGPGGGRGPGYGPMAGR